MRKPVLVIAAILVATGASSAQPAPSAPPVAPGAQPSAFGPPSQLEPPPPPVRPPSEPAGGRQLSETTALGLSLGGTLAGWTILYLGMQADSGTAAGIGLLGTLLGPNAGHWYGGAAVTRGTGLRLLGGATAIYGFMRAAFCEDSCNDTDEYLMIGGALLYLGATVDDIITAPRRVRRHNKELELELAPMVAPRSAGIAVGGRF